MAGNGGTDAQLMNFHNWKTPAMAQEYIANSKSNQIQRVKLLTGIDLKKSPATSTVTSASTEVEIEKNEMGGQDGNKGKSNLIPFLQGKNLLSYIFLT